MLRAAGVRSGDRVRIETATGQMVAPVRVSDEIAPGVVSIPHGLQPHNVSRLNLGPAGPRGACLRDGSPVWDSSFAFR